ncbi:hypothetical protein [uncultured Campylobacter sp.]|uniref:hypothetical protein n=1 Tax=uncultured Campylobacter sp. TaxID=218934 RepID=UPI002638E58E|nr:hypothetical protein [uncultured Campylobacter sp.]
MKAKNIVKNTKPSAILSEAEAANLALFIEKEALILEFYSLGAKNFKSEGCEKILKFRAEALQKTLNFATSCGAQIVPPASSDEILNAKSEGEFLASALLIEKSAMMFYDDLINSSENEEFKDLLYRAQAVSYNEILPILKELNSKINGDDLLNFSNLLGEILKNPQNLDEVFKKFELQDLLNRAFSNLTKEFFAKN